MALTYYSVKSSFSIFMTSLNYYFSNSHNNPNASLGRVHSRSRGYDYNSGYDEPRADYYDRRRPVSDYDRRASDQQREYKRPPPKQEERGGGSVLGIVIRIIFMILILAFFIMPQFEEPRNTFIDYLMAGLYKYQEVPDTVDFSVKRVLTIESDDYLNYTLYLPKPINLKIDGQEAQLLKDFEHAPQYDRRLSQNEQQWVWNEILNTGGTDTITIIYHFKTAKISWDISIKKSGTIDDIPLPELKRWGGNQWPVADYNDRKDDDFDNDGITDTHDVDDENDGVIDKYRIEPSNPEIQSLLIEILNDAGIYSGNDLNSIGHLNVYKVVKAIYDEIDKECAYPNPEEQVIDSNKYGGYPKWGTGTWDDKRGDCDDQSILFISLCRAAGIPAMLEIGALYDPNFDRWEGHGWANVYIPYTQEYSDEKGYNHITPMVDIVNDIFLFRDPNRFSEWVDDGKKGRLLPDGDWEPSHLEDHYRAWQYYYDGTYVDTTEAYGTLEWDAKAPKEKLYI
jgi:hypothetical protein